MLSSPLPAMLRRSLEFSGVLFTKIRASFMTLKFSASSPFLFILKLKHLKPMLLKDRTVKHSLPFSPTLSPLALATSLLLKHTIYSNQLRKKIGLLGFRVLEALVHGQWLCCFWTCSRGGWGDVREECKAEHSRSWYGCDSRDPNKKPHDSLRA